MGEWSVTRTLQSVIAPSGAQQVVHLFSSSSAYSCLMSSSRSISMSIFFGGTRSLRIDPHSFDLSIRCPLRAATTFNRPEILRTAGSCRFNYGAVRHKSQCCWC